MQEVTGSLTSSSDSTAELQRLQASYRSLRSLFHVIGVAMLLLTGTLFIFIYRQASLLKRQAGELGAFVADYEKNHVPQTEEFKKKLLEFAKTHPDFNAVLAKYSGPPKETPAAGSLTNLPAMRQP